MSQILDDLVTEVTAHENLVDSIIVLLKKIHDLLAAAVDNSDTAGIQNVIAMLKDKDTILAQAVVDNTPAIVAPPVVPAVPAAVDTAGVVSTNS